MRQMVSIAELQAESSRYFFFINFTFWCLSTVALF